MSRFTKLLATAVAAVTVLLAGCQERAGQGAAPATAHAPGAFRILAGSELKDIAPAVEAYARSQNVQVQFDYTGSLDAVDTLSEPHSYDAVWLSHGKYLQLVDAVRAQIKASEKTMFSRVVLGVKPEKAKELGWSGSNATVSWKDVLSAAKSGKLRLAMTSPTGSNTGFVTLVGVAAELSGKGDALEPQDIPSTQLQQLFSKVTLTSGSSGDLAERFKAQPDQADAMVNYEATLKALGEQGLPLQILVPKEGVVTADYPLMLLKRSSQQATYDKLVAYLRDPQTQQSVVQTTGRTPLAGAGDDEVVNELPFPGSVRVVDALLDGYLNQFAKASTSHFVLDVSGSMSREGRMDALHQAMTALTSSDGSVSGRFSTFRDREDVVVTPFSHFVHESFSASLSTDKSANQASLATLGEKVRQLQPDGGTAMFDALMAAYPKAQAVLQNGDRRVSIVLMTDGENRDGSTLTDFEAFVARSGEPKVPVFAVLYGEANSQDMLKLAQITGGRVFDARKTSLRSTLKSIRTFQ